MLAGRTSGGYLVHHPAQSKVIPTTTSGQLWPYLSLENKQEWRFSSLSGKPVSVLYYSGEKVFLMFRLNPQSSNFWSLPLLYYFSLLVLLSF